MLNSALIKKESKVTGYGIFTTRDISKDELIARIVESESRLITLDDWFKLPPQQQLLTPQFGRNMWILTNDGSDYINHSCDPNTWWLSDLELIASRKILSGEEITNDYATTETDPDPRFPIVLNNCLCGSKNCRKIITTQDCLNPEFQKRYENHLPSWTLKYIEENKKQMLSFK